MHLLSLFDEKIYCDQQIMVHVPGAPPTNYYFEAHKMVISRSPLLAVLLYANAVSGNESNSLTLFWPYKLFYQTAFTKALRYLYSESVLSVDEIESMTYSGGSQHISQWRSSQLMFTIAYWLGGLVLQAEAVARQAETIARCLINFDTIGTALAATADLCDHRLSIDERDQEDIHHLRMFEIAETLSFKLYDISFGFLASSITFEDFQLDTTLEQTLVKPLLPLTRSLADHYHPRIPVQTIQFGQLPPEQATFPVRTLNSKDRQTSYIMLNLHFWALREAIAVMRRAAKDRKVEDIWVKQFVEKIVGERETRRGIVLRDPGVSVEEQKAHMDVWRVVAYEESVVTDEETGEWDVVAECSEEWARLV